MAAWVDAFKTAPGVVVAAALAAVESGEYEVLVDEFGPPRPRRTVRPADRPLPGTRDARAAHGGLENWDEATGPIQTSVGLDWSAESIVRVPAREELLT
jgi:hypothetical protein